jgi:hypothetical protein
MVGRYKSSSFSKCLVQYCEFFFISNFSMGPYNLTPEEQNILDDFEKDGVALETFLCEPEEPEEKKKPTLSHEDRLYDVIWSKAVWLRLHQKRANTNSTQSVWLFFQLLEREWNLEAPHPSASAFEALAQIPTAAKFKPEGLIQSQHQNIVAKLLVGSVVWWFAPCSFNFLQPSDNLITSLVKYDACISEEGSIVGALKRLHERFGESKFEAFNFDFIGGQINHAIERQREKQEKIEFERQERESRAREAEQLEFEKQKKEKEEAIAKRKRQEELYRKGKSAIAHWLVGDVIKFIAMAKEENFEELFQTWLQDAEQLQKEVGGIRKDNMVYRVHKIMSTLREEALSVEINS